MQSVMSRSEARWAWVPVNPKPSMPVSVVSFTPTTPQWVIECVESEIDTLGRGMCKTKGSTATIFMT